MRKTKIIATLGPVSFNPETILALIEKGMDVARINMSHYYKDTDLESHIQLIRKQAEEHNRNVAVLFDLCGPKIRVGKLDTRTITIHKGKHYTLGNLDCDIPLNMEVSFHSIVPGGMVKVNDGKLSFEITSVDRNTLDLIAKQSGDILSGKGVNFPGVQIDLPSLTDKDIQDLQLAVSLGADWLAMSFVRSANDYNLIKDELGRIGVSIPVIAN